MSNQIFPVILAGGSGTRLWPLSRKNFPKQFLCLNNELSLLQQTVQRALMLQPEQILIVSNEAHYYLCLEQLQIFKNQRITYLLEPCPRNTAAAIGSAAHYLMSLGFHDTVMLILPSDHWIGDISIWQTAISNGVLYAETHPVLATFGIQPTHAETGYGYIETAHALSPEVFAVRGFYEKPTLETAQTLLTQGHYYWNSGMFVCQPAIYLDELHQHAPDIFDATQEALKHAEHHRDKVRLATAPYTQCRSESIDYAIMEKTKRAVIIPSNMSWNDMGCWTSVAETAQLNEEGNALQGNVMTQDTQDCFISSKDMLVATLGIQDQIIVTTSDAVLVADKRYSQEVKDLVNTLSLNHKQFIEEHRRVARPWGYYEVLIEGETFKVKRIMVKPGASLSLQMHQHRAEHWVVVGGQATVINDGNTILLDVNQSTYIPKKTRHRLSNQHHAPLYVIEVQSGHYLGEDDIIRFDDIYERVDHAVD